jgi:hypothetical protein
MEVLLKKKNAEMSEMASVTATAEYQEALQQIREWIGRLGK